MQHSRRMRAGLTIGEVVVLGVLLALLVALVLPMLATATHTGCRPRCRHRQRQLFQGVRMYLNNYEEFFPLAWHEGSGDGLGEVTYSRFLLQMAADTNVQFRDAASDAEKAELLTNNTQFWHDPGRGLTNDYFSPPAILRLPAPGEMTKPYGKNAHFPALTARIPPAERPFLTDVYASTPQPDAKDVPLETRVGIHGAFKRNAFVLGGKSYDAFYGVARSWVGWQPDAKEGSGPQRFDFRHNGAISVLFLDGRVDTIRKDDAERLRPLHEAWNIKSKGAP